jgi:hypothetical protein
MVGRRMLVWMILIAAGTETFANAIIVGMEGVS